MGFNSRISLVDIDTVVDEKTGKRTKKIVRETVVYADKQEVGMQEFYSAAGIKIQLTATYEIPADKYHGERYILTDNRTNQYEITRAGKGRSLGYIRIPVKNVKSKDLLEGMNSGT